MKNFSKLKMLAAVFAAFLLVFFPYGKARANGAEQDRYGGTMRLVAARNEGLFDPQINYTQFYWELFPLVYDGLVTFRQAGGKASLEIVPDLAVSVPKPTDHGLTYSFTLRRGIYFSDGKEVTVADVKYSFIRLFKILNPNLGPWFSAIAGGEACMRNPATCTLPGLTVNPVTNRVVFHLSRQDPAFLDQLAGSFGVIIPAGTPDSPNYQKPLIGTGAYRVAYYNPQKELVLVRNPYFKMWNKEAQPKGYPDKIVLTFGLSPNEQVTAVLNNQYDWMLGPVPTDRLPELAEYHPDQLHVNPMVMIVLAPFNVNIPPFNNKDARLAVTYAVNRQDLVKIAGGKALATPVCQFLPKDVPGYKPYCPYKTNWAKAEYYMKKSGMAGQPVTIISYNTAPYGQLAIYLESLLNKLGFKARLHIISSAIEYNYIQNTANQVQLSLTNWYQDYPRPADFLRTLFSCTTFRKDSDNSSNISGFCDPHITAEMQKAQRIGLTEPEKAARLWTKIDRQITDQAPALALLMLNHVDLTSERVRNFTFSRVVFFLPQLSWLAGPK